FLHFYRKQTFFGGVSNVMLFKVTTKTNHNFVVTTLKAYVYIYIVQVATAQI
ncbi:MAG: hypothetical protein ACI9LN_004291, partial [Saprospiraceae bacterium]